MSRSIMSRTVPKLTNKQAKQNTRERERGGGGGSKKQKQLSD